MNKFTIIAFIVTIAFLYGSADASECPQLYPNNTPIEVPGTVELCSSFFVVRYDPVKKAAILTSEIVSARRVMVPRVDSFRPDERLSKAQRATNADYLHTGYDKGHMVPAGDSMTPEQMRETFRLSNMTPQSPSLNREAWRELEYMIRGSVTRSNADTWAVTGAVYSEFPVTIGKNKIPVPVGYYKIVYYAAGTKAYYAHNSDESAICIGTSVADIKLITSFWLQN